MNSKMQRVDYSQNNFGQRVATIIIDTTTPDGSAETIAVTVEPGNFNYKGIINAIVRARYDQPAMEAINNNYLDDPTNEQYLSEREDMKAWRSSAKAIAKELCPEE